MTKDIAKSIKAKLFNLAKKEQLDDNTLSTAIHATFQYRETHYFESHSASLAVCLSVFEAGEIRVYHISCT